MISPYFKEYIIKLFKRHSRDIYITLIFYFITLYFLSIRSEYALVTGAITLLVLIFIKKFESKTFAQAQLNSRAIELLLLPLSAKEMFYAQLIKIVVATLPVYVVISGMVASIGFYDTGLSLFQFACYEFMVVFLFFLISTEASMRMNFVKTKKIHKLTTVTSFLNYYFVLFSVFFVGIGINKFYKTNQPAILIYFVALFVFIVYLSFNVEKKYLHEHKIYSSKNFKLSDIPGTIIMLLFIGSIFYSMIHPIRSPSSISKETIRK